MRYSIVRHTPRCLYTLQIRCRYVADTSDIRQKYVIHALLIRYNGPDGGITLWRIVLAYASVLKIITHTLVYAGIRWYTLVYASGTSGIGCIRFKHRVIRWHTSRQQIMFCHV